MSTDTELTFPMVSSRLFAPPDEILALREHPIARLRYPNGKLGWVVTRHATIRTVLTDPRFSARQELRDTPYSPIESMPPAEPGMFIGMDPPDHTRYRKLLTGQFTVHRMRRLTDHIAHIADEYLDRMAASGPGAELVAAYAGPIPAQVICELLGVPLDYRERFMADATTMSAQDTPLEDRQKAIAGITGYLGELVARKRAEPTDDLLGGLIADESGLSDAELTNLAFLLLGGGLDTTTNMLGLGTFALLRNPEQISHLMNPDTCANSIEELLRYLSIVPGTIRAALTDLELEGEHVSAGESVLVSISGGNRDPGHFADPDTLDLTRRTAGHLAFGHGVHQCIGQQLARVEMQVGFRALFRRFPSLRLAVPPEDVPLRDDMIIFGVHRLPVTWDD